MASLTILSSCEPTTSPPATAPADEGGLSEGEEPGVGFVSHESGWGVDAVPRADALARIARAPARVLVELDSVYEECRNALVTHAYFRVPAASGTKPFAAATLTTDVLWRELGAPRGQLFLAGVELGTLHASGAISCSGPMPPSDARILAIVPVKSAEEGARVLRRLRR